MDQEALKVITGLQHSSCLKNQDTFWVGQLTSPAGACPLQPQAVLWRCAYRVWGGLSPHPPRDLHQQSLLEFLWDFGLWSQPLSLQTLSFPITHL